LATVFEHYKENQIAPHSKSPVRALRDAESNFKLYLASWRNRPLSSIHREHIREKHAEIGRKHGPVTANRQILFLRAMINHAIHPDIGLRQGVNPVRKPKKFLYAETSRARVLTDKEKLLFFAALESETHQDLKHLILLALATGSRRGALQTMRWSEIDFERKL